MMITRRPLTGGEPCTDFSVPVPRRHDSGVEETLLPGELTSLIGREKLLQEGARTFISARVLTLIGPGGVGKTRVADRLAREMTSNGDIECGRVHLADLREGEDRLAAVIAQAFGLRENSPAPAEDLLITHLRSRKAVLLLDNCEHLVGRRPGSGPVPQLLRRLLRAAPGLRVLATSQIRLGLDGEHLLQVPPLCTGAEESSDCGAVSTMHEALRLLIVRARAAGVEIAESDLPVANRLCRLLDGLPLAIELAASQLDVLSLHSIVEHPDLLGLLEDGARTEAHHHSLRAMLELSRKLLSGDEQRMWALMTVFEAGFDLEAAQAVCTSQGVGRAEVQPLLSQLVRKSLLQVGHQDGTTRYRMLCVIRQYGQELLSATTEDTGGGGASTSATSVHQAHAEHFGALAKRCSASRLAPGEVEWMHRMNRELPNLRAAQQHFLSQASQRGRGLDLAIDVARTRCHIFTGQLNDSSRMLKLALRGDDETLAPSQVVARSILAWTALLQGHRDLALPLLDMAERDARELGVRDILAPLLFASGTSLLLAEPDPVRARAALAVLERAEEAFRREGNAGDTFMAMLFRAMSAAFLGDRDQARVQRDRLMAAADKAQAQWSMSWARWTSALVEFVHGSAKRSIALAQDALRLQRQIGDTWGPTWSAWLIAVATAKVGDHELAGRIFGAVDTLQRDSQTHVLNMQPFLRVDSQTRERCRHVIGADRFNQAINAGEGLSIEDGLALALTPLEKMRRSRTGENLLTAKEFEVIRHIAQGKRYAEIGQDLDISDRTVEVHVRNAKRKLDVGSKSDLVAWYLEPSSSSPG
jgi:non-specific serine/threonine protein kinase